MFTGIVEEIGVIKEIRKQQNSIFVSVKCSNILEDAHIGDSISVNGVCLTLVQFQNNVFSADVSLETINKSSLSMLDVGYYVNLERALKVGDRFGGHIVSGHIDGCGNIDNIEKGKEIRVFISANVSMMKYIVEKGSVTLNGVSLTVADVSQDEFSVALIPHTFENTTFKYLKKRDKINIECDIIGKYVEKMVSPLVPSGKKESRIDNNLLIKHGFC